VTWRTTKRDGDALDIRCDLCRKPATTVHWVPWVSGLKPEKVLFACVDHDPGGYWVDLSRWFDPKDSFPAHIAAKEHGDEAVAMLESRLDELRRL
jgi:hypothetical protein